jgi:hypothetical protein
MCGVDRDIELTHLSESIDQARSLSGHVIIHSGLCVISRTLVGRTLHPVGYRCFLPGLGVSFYRPWQAAMHTI